MGRCTGSDPGLHTQPIRFCHRQRVATTARKVLNEQAIGTELHCVNTAWLGWYRVGIAYTEPTDLSTEVRDVVCPCNARGSGSTASRSQTQLSTCRIAPPDNLGELFIVRISHRHIHRDQRRPSCLADRLESRRRIGLSNCDHVCSGGVGIGKGNHGKIAGSLHRETFRPSTHLGLRCPRA